MRGGWSGFGMATVGIHPNDFYLNPNKIPTGGVIQNGLTDLTDPTNLTDPID